MPAFRLIYQLFVLNLKVIFYRNICTTIVFFVVLVLLTLMSAKPVKISDRGVFLRGSMCSHRSYTTVNNSPFKTNPKISNSDFLSTS